MGILFVSFRKTKELTNAAVLNPLLFKNSAKVISISVSSLPAPWLNPIEWFEGYFPVNIEACAGIVNEEGEKAFLKSIPRFARASSVGLVFRGYP